MLCETKVNTEISDIMACVFVQFFPTDSFTQAKLKDAYMILFYEVEIA